VDPGHFGTEPDPALFVRDLQDAKKNQNFLAFYFLKVHLHYFLKIKLSSRCHKTVEIKARFFLLCLLDDGRRIRIRTNNDGSGSGRSKQHKDPVRNTDAYRANTVHDNIIIACTLLKLY
jgi:hypothetical protein